MDEPPTKSRPRFTEADLKAFMFRRYVVRRFEMALLCAGLGLFTIGAGVSGYQSHISAGPQADGLRTSAHYSIVVGLVLFALAVCRIIRNVWRIRRLVFVFTPKESDTGSRSVNTPPAANEREATLEELQEKEFYKRAQKDALLVAAAGGAFVMIGVIFMEYCKYTTVDDKLGLIGPFLIIVGFLLIIFAIFWGLWIAASLL